MSKVVATHKHTRTEPKAAATGRVFTLSLKGVPPVSATMWSQMEAAARAPRKNRRYPEIIETP
jgi:hypothetical protein